MIHLPIYILDNYYFYVGAKVGLRYGAPGEKKQKCRPKSKKLQ